MKKWFYAHRKQIFAILVVFVLVSGSMSLTVSAEQDDNGVVKPTPTAPFPNSPTYSDPVYVDTTGLYDYVPLYNAQFVCNFMPTGYEPIPYKLIYDASSKSSVIGNYTPLGTSHAYRVVNSVYNADVTHFDYTIPYLRNSLRVSNTGGDARLTGVAIQVRDFWYIPFSDYDYGNANQRLRNNRDIMKIRMNSSFIDIGGRWGISGTFQYEGNILEHDFSYFTTPTHSYSGFNVGYMDIIQNSPIGSDGHQVPIYIKELNIVLPADVLNIFFDSYAWIDIYTPYLTVDEQNMLYDNNLSVFENTSYNYQQWDFDFAWAMSAVNSVLNAPLFGPISLGGIAFTVVGTVVGISLIKLLGGAK